MTTRARTFIAKNWFTLSIPVVIGTSCAFPQPFRSGGTLSYEKYKSAAVSTMFLCSGICIPGVSAFSNVMRRHSQNIFIQGMSLVGIPLFVGLTAPTFVSFLGLPKAVTTGAIFVACLPTTIGLSIALTKAAGGSVVLSTFHSAVGNAIGPFITPLMTAALVGLSADTDAFDVFQRLGKLIIIPLAAGLALRSAAPAVFATAAASRVAGILQQLCLLTMLSNVFSTSYYKRLQQEAMDVAVGAENGNVSTGKGADIKQGAKAAVEWSTLGVIAAMMAAYHTVFFVGTAATAAYFPAFFGGVEGSIAATYVVSQKTAAMGIAMVELLFEGDDDLDLIVAPLLLYHMYQIFFGAVIGQHLFARLFAKQMLKH